MMRAVSGALAACAVAACAVAPAAPATALSSVVQITWMRVDTAHPQVLYVGGYRKAMAHCVQYRSLVCPVWSMRSEDGGATRVWIDHSRSPNDYDYGVPTNWDFGPTTSRTILNPPQPFLVAPDTGYLYRSYFTRTTHVINSIMLRSLDRGTHWQTLPIPADTRYPVDPFNIDLALSPAIPARLYTMHFEGGENVYNPHLVISDDGGGHWRTARGSLRDPLHTSYMLFGGVVADARDGNTVYVGLGGPSEENDYPNTWVRSEDAGSTWSIVATPGDRPTLDRFTLATDPHLPGHLVARSSTRGVPPDRRYVSTDHGRTWRIARCPGDLGGRCPHLVVDNLFGDGRSYGFYSDGIHAFRGDGAAGPRLALTDRLPVPPSQTFDVRGGARAMYLLGGNVAVDGPYALYRSVDAGHTWQKLAVNQKL